LAAAGSFLKGKRHLPPRRGRTLRKLTANPDDLALDDIEDVAGLKGDAGGIESGGGVVWDDKETILLEFASLQSPAFIQT
jgi:hypothetical protein